MYGQQVGGPRLAGLASKADLTETRSNRSLVGNSLPQRAAKPIVLFPQASCLEIVDGHCIPIVAFGSAAARLMSMRFKLTKTDLLLVGPTTENRTVNAATASVSSNFQGGKLPAPEFVRNSPRSG